MVLDGLLWQEIIYLTVISSSPKYFGKQYKEMYLLVNDKRTKHFTSDRNYITKHILSRVNQFIYSYLGTKVQMEKNTTNKQKHQRGQ